MKKEIINSNLDLFTNFFWEIIFRRRYFII